MKKLCLTALVHSAGWSAILIGISIVTWIVASLLFVDWAAVGIAEAAMIELKSFAIILSGFFAINCILMLDRWRKGIEVEEIPVSCSVEGMFRSMFGL